MDLPPCLTPAQPRRRPRTTFAEPAALVEVPLAGHVVDFDADAVGVLEQHRVVTGREVLPLFGRVDDLRVELGSDELVDRVDLLAVARAEADVMEPGAILIERLVALVGGRAAREDARA